MGGILTHVGTLTESPITQWAFLLVFDFAIAKRIKSITIRFSDNKDKLLAESGLFFLAPMPFRLIR
jgi:hypothetical protein